MLILIVDDSEYKVEKIKNSLVDFEDECNVLVAGSNSEAISILKELKPIQLLILDLNLPVRPGAKPKKDSGLKLLKEISKRSNLTKPESVIGLTSYPEFRQELTALFESEGGWIVLDFDPSNSKWEEILKTKVIWLLERNVPDPESKKPFHEESEDVVDKIKNLLLIPLSKKRLRVLSYPLVIMFFILVLAGTIIGNLSSIQDYFKGFRQDSSYLTRNERRVLNRQVLLLEYIDSENESTKCISDFQSICKNIDIEIIRNDMFYLRDIEKKGGFIMVWDILSDSSSLNDLTKSEAGQYKLDIDSTSLRVPGLDATEVMQCLELWQPRVKFLEYSKEKFVNTYGQIMNL